MHARQRARGQRIARHPHQQAEQQAKPPRIAGPMGAPPEPEQGRQGQQRDERMQPADPGRQRAQPVLRLQGGDLRPHLETGESLFQPGGDMRAQMLRPQRIADAVRAELRQEIRRAAAQHRERFAPERAGDDGACLGRQHHAAEEDLAAIGAPVHRAFRRPEEGVGIPGQAIRGGAEGPAGSRAFRRDGPRRRPIGHKPREQEGAAEGRKRQPPMPHEIRAQQQDHRAQQRRRHAQAAQGADPQQRPQHHQRKDHRDIGQMRRCRDAAQPDQPGPLPA